MQFISPEDATPQKSTPTYSRPRISRHGGGQHRTPLAAALTETGLTTESSPPDPLSATQPPASRETLGYWLPGWRDRGQSALRDTSCLSAPDGHRGSEGSTGSLLTLLLQ